MSTHVPRAKSVITSVTESSPALEYYNIQKETNTLEYIITWT